MRRIMIFSGILWLLGAVAGLAGQDETVAAELAQARTCFQNSGGPQGCPTVFGWCSAAGAYAERLDCRERMATRWEAVLEEEWARLTAFLAERDLRDRIDGHTPVAVRIAQEQTAWTGYRDARCGWDLPPAPGNITGAKEAQLRCRETMDRARAQQLWDMALYLRTTPLPEAEEARRP